MGRPRAFDRDEAVTRAMGVFWDRGYEATSTEDLLAAMNIGRQSMYDTFGDKHGLYLEALERYTAEHGAALADRLRAGESPLDAIAAVLLAIAAEPAATRARGCMGVNAISELAPADPSVAALARTSRAFCEAAIERVVRDARTRGELRAGVEPRAAARFLLATLQGLRVSAKAGAPPEALRDIATLALDGLRA